MSTPEFLLRAVIVGATLLLFGGWLGTALIRSWFKHRYEALSPLAELDELHERRGR